MQYQDAFAIYWSLIQLLNNQKKKTIIYFNSQQQENGNNMENLPLQAGGWTYNQKGIFPGLGVLPEYFFYLQVVGPITVGVRDGGVGVAYGGFYGIQENFWLLRKMC